ncbi:MAG: hypothetical protein KDH96_11465, partial [Candidatus Riesia sp.]|nr:hypothetical protein [Candidatus Riesia sp.]
MGIEYNGRKPFSRPRKLEETSDDVRVQDIPKDPTESVDERQEAIDGIFTDLAKTYLKGKVIQEGLSNMDPAQFIPVEEYADAARAGASRLAQEDSQNGNIITYGLYQKAIEIILDKKWELRGTIIDMKIPASVSQVTQETHEKLTNSDKVTGFLKEFISQNGIVTTIIGMLTISPFQTIIFQALGVENTAKGVQISQIPAGIALFLELGIKAERIYNALKS